ncbi:hypothetical protein R1flu_017116 [Riccia fluitans]|uniref:non-specific serine/threonine protein kinase n=1 Tax=Riccia fluitans TaxID=41844 RepID=A0ABD1YP62_9MARC
MRRAGNLAGPGSTSPNTELFNFVPEDQLARRAGGRASERASAPHERGCVRDIPSLTGKSSNFVCEASRGPEVGIIMTSGCFWGGNFSRELEAVSPAKKLGEEQIYLIFSPFTAYRLLLLVVVIVFAYFQSRQRWNTQRTIGAAALTSGVKDVVIGRVPSYTRQTKAFTFDEVRAATTDFNHKIGDGRFGPVYYGKLPHGQEVAVKVRPTNYAQGGEQDGHLITEVNILAKIHHQNLVSLLGHCLDPINQVLVYEYMRNGTLRSYLQRSQVGQPSLMNWRTRLHVMMDAARGLHSLHTDWNPVIIHRDFNSINVMLDENMNAKVADFGVSKIALDDDSGIPTLLKCTAGYLDPEYFTTQKLTPKSDVYSFGVVLFEIISGRSPIMYSQDGTRWSSLVEWVKLNFRDGKVKAIVDPSLQGLYAEESVRKVAEVALSCLEFHGPRRPDMEKVMLGLAEALHVEDTHHQQQIAAAAVSAPTNNISMTHTKNNHHQVVYGMPLTTTPGTDLRYRHMFKADLRGARIGDSH